MPRKKTLPSKRKDSKQLRKSPAPKIIKEKCVIAPAPSFTLHIFSDATGGLATHTLTAILTQFPSLAHEKHCHIFQRTPADIKKSCRSLKRDNTLVFYALVEEPTQNELRKICTRRKIPHFDLTSSLAQFLSQETGIVALKEIHRLHKVDEGYLKRIEAMEFTAKHDDGRSLPTVHLGEIILVGLSRVSKSPTATYLGSQGYKVANIPVDPLAGFPPELNATVKKKVVALTLQPKKLQEIRKLRLSLYSEKIEKQGLDDLDYYDLKSIIHEVMYAETEYKKRGYPILNITKCTVEETAVRILKLLKIKHQDLSFE